MTGGSETNDLPRCSFCKKDAHEVRRLVAGPGVHICDECVAICADIIADAAPIAEGSPERPHSKPRWSGGGASVRCSLCGMPCLGEDVLLVEGRGIICRPCVADVEAMSANDKWARYAPKS